MAVLKGSYSNVILKQCLIHILYVRFLDAQWECPLKGLQHFSPKLKPILKLVYISFGHWRLLAGGRCRAKI